jgi:hypothetical protein
MNNLNNYIQSITVHDPMGLLNPGVIIIGKTNAEGDEYYPARVWEELDESPDNYIEVSTLPSVDNPTYSIGSIVKQESTYYILKEYEYPVYYQYKVSNEKD